MTDGRSEQRTLVGVAEMVRLEDLESEPLVRAAPMKERDLRELERTMLEFGLRLPIVIDQDNRIVDGHHRVAAARRLGWSSIESRRVETHDAADVIVQAYRLNDRHGVRLTTADRRHAILQMLLADPAMSKEEVRQRLGVAWDTVRKVREKHRLPDGDANGRRRGRDDKSYPAHIAPGSQSETLAAAEGRDSQIESLDATVTCAVDTVDHAASVNSTFPRQRLPFLSRVLVSLWAWFARTVRRVLGEEQG